MGQLLGSASSLRRELRQLLAGEETIVAPGCYDALSARLVEEAGFSAAYMTGFGTTASLIGRPDLGLLSGTEMIGNARRIVQAVNIPLICDADTGYGNQLNVIRTVREYEQAGVAAIHLEDQVTPKKCGHMSGKAVVPAPEMEAKIRAAVAARTDEEFTIIARTDAVAVEGLGEALERGRRYRDAGADMLFIEAPTTEADIEKVAETFAGTPLVFNLAEGGRTPHLPFNRIQELGFRLLILPISTMLAATTAMRQVLQVIKEDGTPTRHLQQMTSFGEFVNFIGLPEANDLQERFSS
jgi:carboxyvinyl-carboxyphosphonate phosphorylmutase